MICRDVLHGVPLPTCPSLNLATGAPPGEESPLHSLDISYGDHPMCEVHLDRECSQASLSLTSMFGRSHIDPLETVTIARSRGALIDAHNGNAFLTHSAPRCIQRSSQNVSSSSRPIPDTIAEPLQSSSASSPVTILAIWRLVFSGKWIADHTCAEQLGPSSHGQALETREIITNAPCNNPCTTHWI